MSDQGLEQPRPFEQTEQKLAGLPEFAIIDIVDRARRDYAVDQWGIMPSAFGTLEDVRAYLRELASEERHYLATRPRASQESVTAHNILATMFEQIAEGDPDQIARLAQGQKSICDERLRAVKNQLDLINPYMELMERLKGMHKWPNAHLVFDPGFLVEARGPIFEKRVLGEDFINATEGNLHNLSIEQRDLQVVFSKWQQAIELAKPNTTNSSTSTPVLSSGK